MGFSWTSHVCSDSYWKLFSAWKDTIIYVLVVQTFLALRGVCKHLHIYLHTGKANSLCKEVPRVKFFIYYKYVLHHIALNNITYEVFSVQSLNKDKILTKEALGGKTPWLSSWQVLKAAVEFLLPSRLLIMSRAGEIPQIKCRNICPQHQLSIKPHLWMICSTL